MWWITIVVLVGLGSAPALADTLVLANGDRINGEIVEWSVRSVVIDHPQLGEIRLALDELAIDTGEPPSPGLFGTDFLRGWERTLSVGANGKDGNTVNENLNVALDMDYDDDFKRWRVDGRYFYASEDNATTDSYGRLDVRRDWLLPDSRWFWRVGGRYQFDKFTSSRARSTPSMVSWAWPSHGRRATARTTRARRSSVSTTSGRSRRRSRSRRGTRCSPRSFRTAETSGT
jgi:hypothetical protein